MYSDGSKTIFFSGEFPSNQNVVEFEADITQKVSDLEIRTTYNGVGEMRIDKVVLFTGKSDLTVFVIIYDIVYLLAAVAVTVSLVNKLKRNRTKGA